MRPKKEILILAPDNDGRAILRFTLETWGYRVSVVNELREIESIVFDTQVDLIIASPDFPGIWEALKDLRGLIQRVPQMLLAPGKKEAPAGLVADVTMFGRFSSEEFRERVKVFSARKRGPRPEVKKPAQSETRVMSAEDRRFA